jgi:uncharacterized protein (DUF1800 family)
VLIVNNDIQIAEDREGGDSPFPEAALATGAAAALALAACGGGSGGGSSSGGSSSGSGSGGGVTDAQASRFLSQAALSARDDLWLMHTLGCEGWLNYQFTTAASGSSWDWLVSQGYNNETYRYSNSSSDFVIWYRLITSSDQLRQRIALALSEYFVVSLNGVSTQWAQFAMAAYWDMLCANAFGNFRQLLEAVTLNAAMGIYLSTRSNRKEDPATGRAPDENYAREVMQLFTIGLWELNLDGTTKTNGSGQPIETYNQDTITNLARVFTGWDLDTGLLGAASPTQFALPMKHTAAWHSTLAATFLGTTVPAGTDGVAALKIALDTLFNHPNVGPFFGRQMIQRLVTSNPSPAYVARVATAFNNNGHGVRGDMQAVIRAILLDSEARSDDTLSLPNGGKLREPMLRFIQWARTFNAKSTAGTWKIYDLSDPATRLAQSPLRSPSVFNYFRPGYTPPNSAVATAGLVAPEFQITNEPTVAGYLNFMQSVIANGIADVKPDYTNELSLVGDPTALVKRINLLLAANQVSAATEAAIITAVTSISASTSAGQLNRVRAAILLVMACPEYMVQK